MKQFKSLLIIIASLSCFFFSFQIASAVEKEITVEDRLSIEEEKTVRVPLTDTAIKLTGPHQEKTFYYEIDGETSSKDHALVLYTRHSELLIEPSAVTIEVDGKPITSKSLTGEETRQKIVVPLEGEALKEGFHSVTVSFNGILKEGVCVVQESSANWLSIDIQSYFKLDGQTIEKTASLKDYPQQFIGTRKRMTTIILPNDASDATRDSGMKIAAYLAEKSNDKKSVQVIREDHAKNIPGEVIIVGAKNEFNSSFMKEVLNQIDIPIQEDALSLSRTRFVEEKQQADVLLVLGDDAEAMAERLIVLLKDQFIEQLSKDELVIEEIPKIAEENQYEIPLKKMGIPSLTLDSTERESEQFFYYAPQVIQQNSGAFLQLYVKRSETLAKQKEREEVEEYIYPDVELTIYINDIPHSVDIRDLEEEDNNMYSVQVPITAKPFNDSHLMSIQFNVSGLNTKDPCVERDENHWVYLAEDSFLAIPQQSEMMLPSLSKFPSPFIGQEEEVIVAYPEEITAEEMLAFYRSVYTVGATPNWQLKEAGKLSVDDVTDAHVIFLSGVNTQPLLQEVEEKLTVLYEDHVPALAPFGFVQEAAEQLSWVQVSPWNENRTIMVFDRLDEKNPYVTEELLTFLRGTNERATIAVQGKGEEIYTNSSQVEEANKEINREQAENGSSTFSIWSIIGFFALIITIVLLLVLVLRRQRKTKGL